MPTRLDGFREEGEICSDSSACMRTRLWSVEEVKVCACGSCPVVKACRNVGKLQLSQPGDCPKYVTLHVHLPQITKK